MYDPETHAILKRELQAFLRAYPVYRVMYRVTPDGDEQIKPELYRAMTAWLLKQGRITPENAANMDAFTRLVEAGEQPWRQ